jgi:hypothetical protein
MTRPRLRPAMTLGGKRRVLRDEVTVLLCQGQRWARLHQQQLSSRDSRRPTPTHTQPSIVNSLRTLWLSSCGKEQVYAMLPTLPRKL